VFVVSTVKNTASPKTGLKIKGFIAS